MTASTRCFRHSAHVWIASCDDCTAWHLASEIARRNQGTHRYAPVASAPWPASRAAGSPGHTIAVGVAA
jgi:hypothetical protein